ncbi:MAG: hypothetical protein WCP55_09645, partial [Lentisphaerota bacterium]
GYIFVQETAAYSPIFGCVATRVNPGRIHVTPSGLSYIFCPIPRVNPGLFHIGALPLKIPPHFGHCQYFVFLQILTDLAQAVQPF